MTASSLNLACRRARPLPTPVALAASLSLSLSLSTTVAAQPAASVPQAEPAPATIVITGNPLGRDTLAQPGSSLSGDDLMLRRAATLGDTLEGLPGTTGSGFGPNSSRPVIRGLDGDRVRLLDNGGASIDASNLSFDHAVAQDPLVTERIELLRGPAALLYGGNATGGVVNSLDNRIPRSPQEGLSARAQWRQAGASNERSGAAVLDGGGSGWAWHADVFGRRTDDLRVPRFRPVEDGQEGDATDRVRNSASRASGGAVGAGLTSATGHAGLALDTYRNDYGVTVEPDVLIRMQRDRLSVGGEQRQLSGLFDQLSWNASHTRYRHQEVEGNGDVGTTFSSRGQEARLQARHRAWGPLQGVLGLQVEQMRFSALGEEAFVPDTRTRSQALFALEALDLGSWQLQAGLRRERVSVASSGDPMASFHADDPAADPADTTVTEPRFGAARERRFAPTSASVAANWRPSTAWALGLTLGHTERAPAYYELYANGVHVATAAYERGDPELGVERSRNLGLTAHWQQGAHQLKASLYRTRFARFISLTASGESIETGEGDAVPEYRFEGVRARLQGFELEGRWRVIDGAWRVDLSALADAVRGIDLDRNEALPRLPPRRLQLGVDVADGPWALGVTARGAARQDRVPVGDTPTPGHVVVNAWGTWRLPLPGAAWTAFARLDNLFDRLAYNAAAVATVRGLSPLAGRAVTVGLRIQL
jgi:iron complex outermembrane recepter protein